MSPATAAALFWYIRNGLVFDLGLDRRPDVALVSYDALVADPEPRMRELCDILDLDWSPALAAHVRVRSSPGTARLDIDRRVRERCGDLYVRLDEAARARKCRA